MRLAVLYEGFSYEIANFQAFVDAAERLMRDDWKDELGDGDKVDGLRLRRLGSGAFRDGFRVEGTPYVLKLGSPRSNRQEYQAYQSLNTPQRRYAAKPVAISHRGYALLMQYVPRRKAKNRMRKVRQLQFGLPPNLRGDLHSDNVRFTERGFPKLIDLQPFGKKSNAVRYEALATQRFYDLLERWYTLPHERNAYNLAVQIYNGAINKIPELHMFDLMVQWGRTRMSVLVRLHDRAWRAAARHSDPVEVMRIFRAIDRIIDRAMPDDHFVSS